MLRKHLVSWCNSLHSKMVRIHMNILQSSSIKDTLRYLWCMDRNQLISHIRRDKYYNQNNNL